MSSIVIVSGGRSPGPAGIAADRLRALGHAVRTVRASDLPVGALLAGELTEPTIAAAVADIVSADALVISTPVRRASCSGLVKSLLDLLPHGALRGTVVLPLVTGDLANHARVVDVVLTPLLRARGAAHVLRQVFVPERQVGTDTGIAAIRRAVDGLAAQVILSTAA